MELASSVGGSIEFASLDSKDGPRHEATYAGPLSIPDPNATVPAPASSARHPLSVLNEQDRKATRKGKKKSKSKKVPR